VHKSSQSMIIFVLVYCMASVVFDAKATACSAFAPNETSFVAANYDWKGDQGVAYFNQRSVSKTAWINPKESSVVPPLEWISKHASFTISQWGRDFPTQGLNQAGLSGFAHNAPANYIRTPGKVSLTELQWLAYQLDRYASVQEVMENLYEIEISHFSGQLQFLFCDSSKECAVVKWTSVGPIAIAMPHYSVRALTNSEIELSLDFYTQLSSQGALSEIKDLPIGYEAINRFARAAWFSEANFRTLPVTSNIAFDQLDDLSPPLSPSGLKSVWQSITDYVNGSIQLRWKSSLTTKSSVILDFATIATSNISFECNKTPFHSSFVFGTGVTSPRWSQDKRSQIAKVLKSASPPLSEYQRRGAQESILNSSKGYSCAKVTVHGL
jgi:penicillin V acylase-like amidase (Ntn superfamily)